MAATPERTLPNGRPITGGASTAPAQLQNAAAAEVELRRRARERSQTNPLSLKDFLEAAWPIVEEGRELKMSWHIEAIVEHLEAVTRGEIRNLIVSMPPRSLKSRIVSVMWPAWSWGEVSPSTQWLYASYSHTLAKRDSVDCRTIIRSDWYQRRYSHLVTLAPDQDEKMNYQNTRAGRRQATSVGSTTTGLGGDFLVIDDPHNVRDVTSDTKREAVLNWHDESWLSRRNDPKTSRRVVVAQRTHDRDLLGHILERDGDSFEHLILPAEYDPARASATSIGWTDPRTEPKELLHPDRMGPKEIEGQRRGMGSKPFETQYNQNPAPDGGNIINPDWLRFWTVEPAGVEYVLHSWDMAFKGEKDGGGETSYVVGQVWACRGAERFLIYQVRERLDFVQTKHAVLALCLTHPPNVVLVEDKANGPAIISELRSKVPGLLPYMPQGSKEARMHSVAPIFEARQVFLPDPDRTGNEWVATYRANLARFPGGASNDEGDATSQALDYLRTFGTGYESV
jgi:predicted phage terminase large subunit-like protein